MVAKLAEPSLEGRRGGSPNPAGDEAGKSGSNGITAQKVIPMKRRSAGPRVLTARYWSRL